MSQSLNTPAADSSRSIVRRRPSVPRVLFRMVRDIFLPVYRVFQFSLPTLFSFGACAVAISLNSEALTIAASAGTVISAMLGLGAGMEYLFNTKGHETPLKSLKTTFSYPFLQLAKWYRSAEKRLE